MAFGGSIIPKSSYYSTTKARITFTPFFCRTNAVPGARAIRVCTHLRDAATRGATVVRASVNNSILTEPKELTALETAAIARAEEIFERTGLSPECAAAWNEIEETARRQSMAHGKYSKRARVNRQYYGIDIDRSKVNRTKTGGPFWGM